MELKDYQPYWNAAEPAMRAKLEELKQQLEGATQYALSEITEGGDEEFRLSLDLRSGDITVLGIDFILLDAEANGEAEGVGVKVDLVGYTALALGGYAPYNYTDQAFTSDVEEVIHRIEDLNVSDLKVYIIEEALTDKNLLQALASA